MATATRDRIVAAGRELFARHGFGQVGLDKIVQQARLTKTTFYNHFESKEQLIREVLDLHELSLRENLAVAVERSDADPRGKLLVLFDVLPQLVCGELPGCNLLVSAAADFPNELDPIRQAVIRNKQAMQQMVLGLCQRAGAPDSDSLACQLVQLLHGAVLEQMLSAEPHRGFADARRLAGLAVDAAFVPPSH